MKRLTFHCPDDLHWRAKVLAAKRELFVRDVVMASLDEYLAREEPKEEARPTERPGFEAKPPQDKAP